MYVASYSKSVCYVKNYSISSETYDVVFGACLESSCSPPWKIGVTFAWDNCESHANGCIAALCSLHIEFAEKNPQIFAFLSELFAIGPVQFS